MSLVDDFLNLIRSEYKPTAGGFVRFDRQVMAKKMKLAQLGKDRGARGVPPADAQAPDTVEQEIGESIRTLALAERRQAEENLATYEDRLRGATPASTPAQMMAIASQGVAELENAMLQARVRLNVVRQEVADREKALADFRQENRLVRPPHPPRGHYVMLAVLALCFFVETIPNAIFLSEGSEYGYIGGYFVAILFSAGNLGFGFLTGRLAMPNLVHVIWGRKLAGFLGTLLLIGLLLAINLLAAHYRGAITDGHTETEAIKLAPERMRNDPLGFLADTKAILMVCLGLGCGFVALIEGLLWQDPYPGYQRVQRHLDQAREHWVYLIQETAEKIQETYGDSASRLNEERIGIENRRQVRPDIQSKMRLLVKSFGDHLDYLADAGRYFIEVYREANIEARGEGPRPPSFSKRWDLTGVEPLLEPREASLTVDWDAISTALLGATKEVDAAHKKVLAWLGQLELKGNAALADAGIAAGAQSERKPDTADLAGPAAEALGEGRA